MFIELRGPESNAAGNGRGNTGQRAGRYIVESLLNRTHDAARNAGALQSA
jgi:hypothetical protein